MAIPVIIFCSILVAGLKAAPQVSIESEIDHNTTEQLVNDIILPFSQVEILSNSVGVQFSVLALTLPNGTKSESGFLIIAAAVSEQWANLRTTEYALKVFSKTLHSLIKTKVDTNLSHWDILTKLDEAYSQDSLLSQPYTKLKGEMEQKVSDFHFISTNISEEQKKELVHNKYGPRMMLFRFLNALNRNQSYSNISQAYFQLAKDVKLYEKVQKIFDETLKESVRLSIDSGPEEQTTIVFTTLMNKLNKDEELKRILQEKKLILPDKL